MAKLKPCPNCKSKKLSVWRISPTRGRWFHVECDECYWCGETKLFKFRLSERGTGGRMMAEIKTRHNVGDTVWWVHCSNRVYKGVILGNLKRDTNSCGCLQAENRFGAKRETEYRVDGDVAYVTAYDGSEIIINTCDLDEVLKHRWRINLGYATSEKNVPMHRMLMKPPKEMDVHHINENKLDNRRSNLLMMTRAEHTSLHNKKSIANGVTVQEWIPVSERLPNYFDHVLINAPGDKPFATVHEAHLRKDGLWDTGLYRYDKEDVTHWMTLPSAPKGE